MYFIFNSCEKFNTLYFPNRNHQGNHVKGKSTIQVLITNKRTVSLPQEDVAASNISQKILGSHCLRLIIPISFQGYFLLSLSDLAK